MQNLKVRIVSKSELGPLVKACARIAERAYSTGTAWTMADFQADMSAAHRLYTVIYEGDRLIGYVGAIKVLDQVDITGVAVDPAHQREGRAMSLLHTLISSLPTDTQVFLEVRESNVAARHLYQRAGFVAVNVRKAYYTNPDEDAILMKLSVSDAKGE
ncbi:ribosomal protein S18-alanine N-acetyltransferase [Lactobacillus sp. LC28-10]|uniref:Ribosomal protein S18-alanine N-acetyltransferase n=1 Tax=Secundilactobacillus angelensis TaxID=2722706 RepID=A0ABX1KZC7_9LACO|nr:ribosomal protein S18-alanine N-acetyltransferase [Secundilactobacillus angelensis]MCH5462219.1 ribosomal protein S18-alanine N-acetyltransferase [Secundilactobacillus angelensis]NLR18510.1 ribosomal protein S18-alanine N-acetyltransferase [Secundilactobacillus angelensis]